MAMSNAIECDGKIPTKDIQLRTSRAIDSRANQVLVTLPWPRQSSSMAFYTDSSSGPDILVHHSHHLVLDMIFEKQYFSMPFR
jgi:hypothetical protein